MTRAVPFYTFWVNLNVALKARGEPETLYGEAAEWFNWTRRERPARVGHVDERLVNRVINARRPL